MVAGPDLQIPAQEPDGGDRTEEESGGGQDKLETSHKHTVSDLSLKVTSWRTAGVHPNERDGEVRATDSVREFSQALRSQAALPRPFPLERREIAPDSGPGGLDDRDDMAAVPNGTGPGQGRVCDPAATSGVSY
ncbi:hypothetical protein GCM10022224_031940 [Nonomuraea antimicrobica]|uniref:Uncharacterized protein n=1 Tax=Nonomuraea antimicrobica TaxID=561173 RepID=A0ABP7BPM0_9ACTN